MAGGITGGKKRPPLAPAAAPAAAAASKNTQLLLLALLLLVHGARAYVAKPPTPRHSVVVMRGSDGQDKQLSRKEWAQCLAGAAGVGAVALGGQRVVRAAQEEREVLVRRPVFSERLYDTRRRSYLPVDPYLLKSNKALDRSVVCVGEVHDDDTHHYAEYAILKVLLIV
jgi:hypothetical protein